MVDIFTMVFTVMQRKNVDLALHDMHYDKLF